MITTCQIKKIPQKKSKNQIKLINANLFGFLREYEKKIKNGYKRWNFGF